jgi:hypothetical protein
MSLYNASIAKKAESSATYLQEAFSYSDVVPDIGTVIFTNSNLVHNFLLGSWKSSNGSYYYKIENDASGNSWTFDTNLPLISFSDNEYFWYVDNTLCVGKSAATATRKCFTFRIVSYKEISIYCEKNGTSYTLYRN